MKITKKSREKAFLTALGSLLAIIIGIGTSLLITSKDGATKNPHT